MDRFLNGCQRWNRAIISREKNEEETLTCSLKTNSNLSRILENCMFKRLIWCDEVKTSSKNSKMKHCSFY